jgi:hypothetical protein
LFCFKKSERKNAVLCESPVGVFLYLFSLLCFWSEREVADGSQGTRLKEESNTSVLGSKHCIIVCKISKSVLTSAEVLLVMEPRQRGACVLGTLVV